MPSFNHYPALISQYHLQQTTYVIRHYVLFTVLFFSPVSPVTEA